MAKAYWVACYHSISDPEALAAYAKLAAPAIAAGGGRFLARGTAAKAYEAGLLDRVLGGVPLIASVSNMVGLEAALALPADAVRRLGALGVAVVEDADRLRLRLRLANAEHERLTSMADGWWHVFPAGGEQPARTLLYSLGPEKFLDRVLLAWSRAPAGAADAAWRELATLPERWQASVFPLKAADLIARGVPKGPQLGRALAAAEEKWISAGFPNDASALQRILDEAARGDEPHSGGAPPHQVRGRLRRGPGAQEN